ncbi:hypothetical protein [Pedobacter africanus]|uniref:Uncharacterized protein n=1 Tax=Pedobacter africanus TaxID=151894 RepID=A0ACC6KQU4_9SPHI|nr:hypothetical protein [Pedobacter africanus]MDR6781705.1 hypothetical protein [Pedobacter africanus]
MKKILLFFPCPYPYCKALVDEEKLPLERVFKRQCAGFYSGKGVCIFINARYRPMKEMDIWARYAVSVYRQTRTIGSGLDEIAGNKKAEVKLQLRHQFL